MPGRWSGSVLLACLGSVPAAAQEIAVRPEVSRRIDSLFTSIDRPHVAGAVVAVIHRGQVIHQKGYGAAQREFDVRWTPATRYRLASISKSLVATAVLSLERQGRLRLGDKIQKYLPDFPELDAPVTIDHLLTMTSGLWQDETLLALASLRGAMTVDDMYRLSQRQRTVNFPPGSVMTYTDTNYRLLARIIAAVTGSTFWEAMRTLVFLPLGMSASLADPSMAHFYDGQAPTYVGPATDSAPPLVDVPFQTSGDGSVITTMRDLVQWLQLLRADHDQPGSLFQRMTAPFRLADSTTATYRRGIASLPYRGLIGWAHGGFTGTFYVFWPEVDLIVAVFANQLGALSSTELALAITDRVLESEGRPRNGLLSDAASRVEPRTGPLSGAEVARLSGLFVDRRSGYVLASDPMVPDASRPAPDALRYDFLGTGVSVAKASDGRFITPALARGIRLEIRPVECNGCSTPDLDVRQPGWPAPLRFTRVRPSDTAVVALADYPGDYLLHELDTHYTVKQEGGALYLEIGAGVQPSQVLRLTPLGRDAFSGRSDDPERFDLFALGRVSVTFRRDPSGRVTGLRFTMDRVRNLDLSRVR